MNMAPGLSVLTEAEIVRIHDAALRIVGEVGMRIENRPILDRLAEFGGQVEGEVVRFSPEFVEGFITESERFDWSSVEPQVNASAGVYIGRYLNPGTGRHESWTEPAFRDYIKLAHYLEHVQGAHMLGCPFDYPNALHPLYQRLLCYRYGARSGGSIWDLRLCPAIVEMTQIIARAKGKAFEEELAATVYLQTPLKFGHVEGEHFHWFAEHGRRVGISHMMTSGATGPVTIAGAVALFLAESLLINIIQRAFHADRHLRLACSISVMDMRSGVHPYGAPERPLANVMMAQMARHYQASFSGHGGHSDAKVPSYEAGVQKVLTGLPILLAGGTMQVSAGLLSIDEVFSPLQMILDNELAGAVKRFAAGAEITDETLAVDLIKQVGPGGQFVDSEHTYRHFRREHWRPDIFNRQLYDAWAAGDGKTDVERAQDIYERIMAQPDLPLGDQSVIADLEAVIARAAKELA